MIFARNSGRSSGGHKQKTQQSTKYSFQYTSWPRDFEMLEGLSCCGSRSSTCCPRHLVSDFTWLIVVHCNILCCTCWNWLKLSHAERMSIGQPPSRPYLVLAPRDGKGGGPPWWRGPEFTLPRENLRVILRINFA